MEQRSLVISGPCYDAGSSVYAPYDEEVLFPEDLKDLVHAIFDAGFKQCALFGLERAWHSMAKALPEVAESHGIPARKLRRLCRLGLIPARLVDGEWQISPSPQLSMRTQMEINKRLRKVKREDPIRITCRNLEHLLKLYRELMYQSPLTLSRRQVAEERRQVYEALKIEVNKVLGFMGGNDGSQVTIPN